MKIPSVSIYWGDSKLILTYKERMDLLNNSSVEAVTPWEVLLRTPEGRLVVIRGLTDPLAPRHYFFDDR